MESPIFKPKLIVIVGPTASGKSTLAINIAKKINGEIVSADSRQIYRGMDIGTAKIKLATSDKRQETWRTRKTDNNSLSHVSCLMSQENIQHYLIDIKNPNEEYTVANYKKDAIKAIEKIIKEGKTPILVGGTGLYIKAVVENLEIPEVEPNAKLREKLECEAGAKGVEHLFQQLVELDPEAAYIVDGKNPRRVIRALEIALATKKPFSAQRKKGEPLFDVLQIGIALPQEKLRKRIEARVDEMIKDGLVSEVNGLVRKYGNKQVAFDAIGYREIIHYLEAKKRESNTRKGAKIISINQPYQHGSAYGLLEAIEDIKKNTWAFAKRQMTWFRKDKNIKWIKTEKEAFELIQRFFR